MSTSLSIQRQNGNVPKTLQGEDHISGFMAYIPSTEVPESFKANRIQALSTIDKAEEAGITADAASWSVRVLHYHLSEIYRTNPAVILYVGVFDKPANNYTFAEVKTMQNYASGKLRQIGVWCGDKVLGSGDDLTTLQGVADYLENHAKETVILYAPKVASVAGLSDKVAGGNKCRVSVVIGQAGSGEAEELYTSKENAGKSSVSGLGTVLGLLSRAKVHQCIAWVKEFPTGITVPAFGDGTKLNTLDEAVVQTLDTSRYLFFITQEGQSGSYLNDSHNMDSAISDYATIESVRTMDKAVRGIRTYVIPELGANVYIDPDTGKLKSTTVSHLETVANHALEDMERAGELSGYKAEVDPEQDVLSSSTVEFVIKNVAVGVMRHVNIKIGFAKSV
ncbi:MAG: DUF2586 domain-containing protein [Prevotella sp.]|nr:DUF2586 domain-containing protein [Prevotella sp.]